MLPQGVKKMLNMLQVFCPSPTINENFIEIHHYKVLVNGHRISSIILMKVVSNKKHTGIFERMMPNLLRKIWLASLAPNPNLIAPLEILWYVDVDRPFERAKQTFHGWENWFFPKAIFFSENSDFRWLIHPEVFYVNHRKPVLTRILEISPRSGIFEA